MMARDEDDAACEMGVALSDADRPTTQSIFSTSGDEVRHRAPLNTVTDEDRAPAARVVMTTAETTAESRRLEQRLHLFDRDDDGDT